AADLGWVRHAPVALDGTAQKQRAGFSGGFVADSDDDVGRDGFEFVPGLAVEPVGGDAMAAQLGDGAGVDLAAGRAAGAEALDAGWRQVVEDGLGEDAPASVVGADE